MPRDAPRRVLTRGGPKEAAVADGLCLAAIAILSSLPYLSGLGFYSDDWSLLAGFETLERNGTLFSSVAQDFVARPVQGLYLVVLFKLFGLNPLGYHLVNTAVIAMSVVLLYLLIVRLRLGRGAAFATAALFVMLPQLSVVRVWYAAFQVPLSMALMFASIHWQLTYSRTRRRSALVGAVFAAVLSIGAYEIFAPLIVGFALALVITSLRNLPAHVRGVRLWRAAIPALVIVATIFLAIAYKVAFSGRVAGIADPDRYLLGLYQLVRPDYDWRIHSGLNIFAALRVYFWLPVRGWATGAEALSTGRSGVALVAISIVLALLVWWRLSRCHGLEEQPRLKCLLLTGVATLLLGHATFLVAPSILFTETGIGTRVQVAAAIGVAMIMVWMMVLASRALGPRLHRQVFAIAVAAVTVLGFVRLTQIERFWAEAPQLQERILSSARSDLKEITSGSTVILDGICPYHGPAIVFEAWWDVGGALTLALGRPMTGDVVSPRMSPGPSGLATSIYKRPSIYPYGPNLYAYDPGEHVLVPLPDHVAAVRYFENRRPANCPPGYVGRGVEV